MGLLRQELVGCINMLGYGQWMMLPRYLTDLSLII